MNYLAEAPDTALIQMRQPLPYSPAEQEFSQYVQDRMDRLLRGEEDRFTLMRRYFGCKKEMGFFMPTRIRRDDVRPEIAESIVYGVLRFLDPFSPGGPISQQVEEGKLTERQVFPTQYPHIVVERTDVYRAKSRACMYVEWRAMRIQNQRKSTAINRALDAGNLAFELVRFIRPA